MGRYRIHGLPKGNGIVFAGAENYLHEMQAITFGDGRCARADFVLKDAVDVRLEIKNREGEAISYADVCRKGMSNEKGEVRLPLPIGTLPFDCAVSAPGYREKHITVDPENGVSKIIFDRGGPAIAGRVVTESGLAVENAKVSVEQSETVYTDKGGRYRIPLMRGGETIITAYKAGYVENRQSHNIEGEGLTDNVIVMSSATGGIYGRVVGSDGSPVSRLRIELITNGNIYDREFENPDGMFCINDVPAGSYFFRVVPAVDDVADRMFSFMIPSIEIKKDFTYGEMYIELQAR